MDKKRLIESAKKFGVEIEFEVDNPGVYDENSGSFFTFEELLGDILPSEPSINKNKINKNNKILTNSYKIKDKSNHSDKYFTNEKYKTDSKQYHEITSVYNWVA
jgi:hypothetical protein